MVRGIKGICAVVGLGLAMVGGRLYAADIYVDQRAEGSAADGSQNAPYVTIQAGVNAAVAGDTVWVKSGDGRDYAIVDDASAVSIPEEKSGLTLRGWGDERVLISCTNEYEYTTGDDGVINWINKTVAPLKIAAPNVVVKDLRFVYTDNSMTAVGVNSYNLVVKGTNYVPYVQFTETAADGKVTDCVIEALEASAYAGAGYKSGIINLSATGVSFEGNRFIGCLLAVGSLCETIFVGNVFTNSGEVVANVRKNIDKDAEYNLINVTVISNTFLNGWDGILNGSCIGLGKLEIGYNIFYNDETAAGRAILKPWQRSISELIFHHNTVVGWKYVWVYQNFWGLHSMRVYDNLIWLEEGGAAFWDKQLWDNINPYGIFVDSEGRWVWASMNDEDVAWGTITEVSSYFRNNVFREGVPIYADPYYGQTKYGTDLFDADWAYTNLTSKSTVVDNVYLAEAPEFESLDAANEKFMRAKQTKNSAWAWKKYAWTGPNGDMPQYIGAKPYITDGGLVIRIR